MHCSNTDSCDWQKSQFCMKSIVRGWACRQLKSRKVLAYVQGQALPRYQELREWTALVQHIQSTEGCQGLWTAINFRKICYIHFYKYFQHFYKNNSCFLPVNIFYRFFFFLWNASVAYKKAALPKVYPITTPKQDSIIEVVGWMGY